MSKKFPYGYNIDNYIEKAIEKMKETYFWVNKDMFDKKYEFSIKKIDNNYQYISTYHWDDRDDTKILDCDGEGFIENIINCQRYVVESANKVKEIFEVPGQAGKKLTGWYLERYEFRSHELGGYSVFVQAGDRVAGGSRTFFIPMSYFSGDYSDFLDKYCNLVPASFGFTKKELLNIKELKKFLGY